MTAVASPGPNKTPLPRAAIILGRIINPLYRCFDWLYSSEYNPLYRSGTLAVGFLFVLLITGLYLCFFYSVSQPYESLVQIQNQVWVGRWVRSLHRYATVAAVIAIIFHVIQLLVQGKSWGPRTLAWLSGIVLTFMFFVSAWSGYVMVWDLHGQRVAVAGAQMLAVVPLLHDIVTAAFDGTAPIPAGFFFMNLFMHVAIPVVMIMFLWVHTARLSRAVWFPVRAIMLWSALALTALSILFPLPLLQRADLLTIVGRIPTDISTGLWFPWLEQLGAAPVWILLLSIIGCMAAIPWCWRPARGAERPISEVDAQACTGCMQCALDCPYEAIKMVPRADGKRLIAQIIPHHCVSCGICAAACSDFAIGPPTRSARDQLARADEFCAAYQSAGNKLEMVLIACTNNGKLLDQLSAYIKGKNGAVIYPVECCGCVSTLVVERLLQTSTALALIGCPARNCFNRDGGDLLSQRIFEKRVPFLDRSIDRGRLLVTAFSESEEHKIVSALDAFSEKKSAQQRSLSIWWLRARACCASIFILAICAMLAQLPAGLDPHYALLRVAGLLPSSLDEDCHVPSDDDLKNVPLHMRPKEICSRRSLTYQLVIRVDGTEVVNRKISDPSRRVDRPLFLDVEHKIAPGDHLVDVKISTDQGFLRECRNGTILSAGQILLVQYKREEGLLYCG